MALEIITRIPHHFKKLIGYRDDSVVIKNSEAQLILRFSFPSYPKISIIDSKSGKECAAKTKGLKAFLDAEVVSCCDRLILLTSRHPTYQHIAFDPLAKEPATQISPCEGGYPCGLFLHPSAKEYRILNVWKTGTSRFKYHLYRFEDKTWTEIAKPYLNPQPSHKNSHKRELVDSSPAISNGALHWYNVRCHEIMVFDIIAEKLCFKPLPECHASPYCYMSKLLVNEDRLCAFTVSFVRPLVMDIWVLEDYANWSWNRKYTVNMDWDAVKYPWDKIHSTFEAGCRLSISDMLSYVIVLSIHKDEMILFWIGRGMFSFNLRYNTVEKVRLRKSEMYEDIRYCGLSVYGRLCGFMAYTPT